ncbi:uncharacterized protein Tco025E_04074 [Trypanosoma conorhini]|uniref:Uncharacterized protein n=1 Tax=Trypanosoma conorhini TaxID=83891 RepID=A0A422PP94_9TRYP|nr:uncharacterized protein Tco025E_04074 [Trypanosoma conorhini]RNF19566.1 hypothetical protein Tco025E_04074 [Trypanosoma conorhini]
MFAADGIPTRLLPHLLEGIGTCTPGQQRRLMFVLGQLFAFLLITEKRARCVEAYTSEWKLCSDGGPGKLSFRGLPVYPAQATWTACGQRGNDHTLVSGVSRCVPPLRLVQAIALLKSGFPPHSFVWSKIWLEFFLRRRSG